MATYTWEYGATGSGVHFTIVYDVAALTFTVHSLEGKFDLNALWWDDGTNDGSVPKLTGSDNSLNMNGSGAADWDGVAKLSSAGLGKAGENKASFISAGETATFHSSDFGLTGAFDVAHGGTLGVRATSVNGGDSFKLVDTTPVFHDDAPPPVTDLTFGGLSQGFWTGGNHGAHISLWDGQHGLTKDTSAETLFGVNFTGDASDLTLLGALDANGGGVINLARQATAAIINAYNPEDLGGHAYRFTSTEIVSAVQQVFAGSVYDSVKGGELAHVLEFWDHASDDESTPDSNATADDVLTLLLAGAASPNVNTDADTDPGVTGSGSMFSGTLAQVMHELYPAHWA